MEVFDYQGNCCSLGGEGESLTDSVAVRKKCRRAWTAAGIANEKLVRNVRMNAVGQLARGRGGRRRENQLVPFFPSPTPKLSVSPPSL